MDVAPDRLGGRHREHAGPVTSSRAEPGAAAGEGGLDRIQRRPAGRGVERARPGGRRPGGRGRCRWRTTRPDAARPGSSPSQTRASAVQPAPIGSAKPKRLASGAAEPLSCSQQRGAAARAVARPPKASGRGRRTTAGSGGRTENPARPRRSSCASLPTKPNRRRRAQRRRRPSG